MAKQGMKRPETEHKKKGRRTAAVPEIEGKAKSGKIRVRPIIAGTEAPEQKVYHVRQVSHKNNEEKPISDAYTAIDNDLARDNLENDITAADLQDL